MSCWAATARWIGDKGPRGLVKRKNVFDGLPYALYLPTGNEAVFTAETTCEIAECRAPSEARLQPKLITPSDVVSGLRGGGNASRQIVDVITPAFPADKLMVIEVYTPGGNWSSYPPHKHDVHNPPAEVDLDEIYYYRLRQPDGFAMQHLYSGKHGADQTLKVKDGDTVLVHSGFHPVVAGSGLRCVLSEFSRGLRSRLGRHRRSPTCLDPFHVEGYRPAPASREGIVAPVKETHADVLRPERWRTYNASPRNSVVAGMFSPDRLSIKLL